MTEPPSNMDTNICNSFSPSGITSSQFSLPNAYLSDDDAPDDDAPNDDAADDDAPNNRPTQAIEVPDFNVDELDDDKVVESTRKARTQHVHGIIDNVQTSTQHPRVRAHKSRRQGRRGALPLYERERRRAVRTIGACDNCRTKKSQVSKSSALYDQCSTAYIVV